MAAAPWGDSIRRVAGLRALVARFPDSPSLRANLLRYQVGNSDSRTGVYLSRGEDWFSGGKAPRDYKAPPPPDPALLAAFDADAAAGERLDPDNAYFPLMRAAGLFAARRDTEGLDAVRRAGTKTVWREYVEDETEGHLRLADAAYGHGPTLSRAAIVASVLYPHYTDLRGVARVAIAKAVQSEQAGQTERGLAIRRAIMHSGGLMRAQSQTYIGSLVGIAIAAIATARPGGAPMPGNGSGERLSGEERARLRLQAFEDYARRAGHPEDARQAQRETEAGQEVRAVWRTAEKSSAFGLPQITRLAAWWIGGLLTLANAFWLLLLGGLAAWLARLPAMRDGLPLSPAAHGGVAAALLLAALIALSQFGDTGAGPAVASLGSLLLLPLLASLAVRLLHRGAPGSETRNLAAGRFARAFGVTALALLALAGLSSWQGRGLIGYGASLRELGLSGGGAGSGAPQAQEMMVSAMVGGLAVPLLLLLILSVAGRVRRVPVSVALVRGFKTIGVPLACLLLVVYGALALGTVRQERAADAGLRRMVQHEGRYYAALAGRPWPQ